MDLQNSLGQLHVRFIRSIQTITYVQKVNKQRICISINGGLGIAIRFTFTPRRGKYMSMQETVKELGHENRVIDILKIDCEGCEWFTYKDWLEFDIRQILVETHNAPSSAISLLSKPTKMPDT